MTPMLPLKLGLLFVAAASHRVGLKPPNPPPSDKDKVYKEQLFENVVRIAALFSQVSVITCLMSECVALLSLYYQNSYTQRIRSSLCPVTSPSLSALSMPSRMFLLGVSIELISAALRVWCFRTLGKLFTYEITIKQDHKLVTSGPYAYVRHPGYTSGVLVLVGAAMTCFGPGTYIHECQIMATPARWWIGTWIACIAFTSVSLWRRGKIEDERLRGVFGEAWDHYNQSVPCKFVPHLM